MCIDKLIESIARTENPSALGLDTRFEYLPKTFAVNYPNEASAVFAFNAALLEALRGIVPCVKVQAAYYERMGTVGMECFYKTILEAKKLGYVLIIDAKRGDIGATASAYSEAYLAAGAPFKGDFLTVNPYFGSDGVEPFIRDCAATGSGIFVLVKTSNPSSKEFQDMETAGGRRVYEEVALRVGEWGETLIGTHGYSSVGAVVGATWPSEGAALRALLPHTFFLLPGYGAQGAAAQDLAGCFDKQGSGAIVAASRSLICAHIKAGTDDFAGAARAEALRMKKDIQHALHGTR